MLAIALLLAVPLGLRYFTVWKMRQFKSLAQRHEEEFRRLQEELGELVHQVRETRRTEREYVVRRSRLYASIHTARQELRKVYVPASGRMAA